MAEMRGVGILAPYLRTMPNSVTPIIEPVNANPRELIRSLELIGADNGRAFVVTNPHQHQLASALAVAEWRKTLDPYIATHAHVNPTLEIRQTATLKEVRDFDRLYANRPIGVSIRSTSVSPRDLQSVFGSRSLVTFFLHASADPSGYSSALTPTRCVEVRDSFRREARNADYSGVELFTTAHHHFKAEGRPGYSDYTILPGVFNANGGPIGAAAIHLTYADNNHDLWVQHFVSDETLQYQGTQSSKLLEAMAKVEDELRASRSKFIATPGLNEYRTRFASQSAPSPTDNKRHQIVHHIATAAHYV